MTETSLLRALLLRATGAGMRLFRNQVGRYRLADGRWLTSGLCVGSSDLIGWTSVTIRPEDVGRTLAVFTAVEGKVGRNTTTTEQGHFLAVVREAGGIAIVARDVTALAHATAQSVDDAPHV